MEGLQTEAATKRPLFCIWLTLCFTLFCVQSRAQDVFTATQCPGENSRAIVVIQVDCSHVVEPATKAQCPVFAQNQACKVVPAYRQLTGLQIERWCPAVQYFIYDKDKWPYKSGPGSEAGGLTNSCHIQYMADYSVLFKTQLGPYDPHEILHIFQEGLGVLPNTHVLFDPSMVELERVLGDTSWSTFYRNAMQRDVDRLQIELEKGTIPSEEQCYKAETVIEDSLYLKDTGNMQRFYSTLLHDKSEDSPQTRFNRMFDTVSGGTAKTYLLQHGCPAF